jgi:hypothetical protein
VAVTGKLGVDACALQLAHQRVAWNAEAHQSKCCPDSTYHNRSPFPSLAAK